VLDGDARGVVVESQNERSGRLRDSQRGEGRFIDAPHEELT
jgi:hypothetical protein